jgi:hypothetical protein
MNHKLFVEKVEEGRKTNVAALRQIVDLCKKKRIAVAIVLLPDTSSFELQRPLFKEIESYCSELGVPCLNLLDSFMATEIKESSFRLNPMDSHPNQKYNRLVAASIAPYLLGVLSASK